MSAIQVDALSKSFGTVQALDNVSFTIPQGKIIGFLGPNGAGKTTTIAIIMQFMKPDNGVVELFGQKIPQHGYFPNNLRKRIGLIPDADLPNINAYKFLRHTGLYTGLSGSMLDNRLQEVIQLVGAEKFVTRNTKTMSKGQRQRIKIANALVHDPDLIIADEPSAGLDPVSRKSLLQLFSILSKEQGKTLFFSNHVISEVERISDQVVMLSNGKVIAEGSIQEIVEKLPVSNSYEVEGSGFDDQLLLSLPEVETVEVLQAGKYLIKVKEVDHQTPLFLKQLVNNPDVNLTSFSHKHLELEDIFFQEGR